MPLTSIAAVHMNKEDIGNNSYILKAISGSEIVFVVVHLL